MFNIFEDETEQHDLRLSSPALFANMTKALAAMAATVYQTDYIEPGTEGKCIQDAQSKALYNGFIGPNCFHIMPPAPPPPPPLRPFSLVHSSSITTAGPRDLIAGDAGAGAGAGDASVCLVAQPKGPGIAIGRCDAYSKQWVESYPTSEQPGWVGWIGSGGDAVLEAAQSAEGAAVSSTVPRWIKLDEHPNGTVTNRSGFCIRGHVYLNADAGK